MVSRWTNKITLTAAAMVENPCTKDCKNRQMGCHALCEAYIAYCKSLEDAKARYKQENIGFEYRRIISQRIERAYNNK